jgi:hypothetical protein
MSTNQSPKTLAPVSDSELNFSFHIEDNEIRKGAYNQDPITPVSLLRSAHITSYSLSHVWIYFIVS